jgi:hypothetical protein
VRKLKGGPGKYKERECYHPKGEYVGLNVYDVTPKGAYMGLNSHLMFKYVCNKVELIVKGPHVQV